ncbi:MAG: hypothetical protein JWN43_1464 [Gammaproteobacteria bacterium]|nr:hypothetical protein [Gammaproteobacteria bacterium]
MSCELVTTGWYAANEPRSYRTAGDDFIRSAEFRPLWWRSLDRYVAPAHVFIVDSASPVKPDDAACTATKFQRVELLKNPGHSQNGKTHYCGAMAAIILGLEFALHNDVEMFMYVEQDSLLFGDSMVEKTKNALRRKDLVFGRGSEVDIQQSLFAANKRGIRRFLSALHAIDYSDKQVAPENKFMFAGSRGLPSSTAGLAVHTSIDKLRRAGLLSFAAICALGRNYEFLPFGYGRHRPINFNDDAFYFQHGSAEEISQYRKLTGF